MAERLCMYEDGYPAEPGKRKCKWHLLLKEPMEDQINEAADRRYVIEVSGAEPRARVPKEEWPTGERWCAPCQSFIPLFYCTGSRCRAHAAESSHNTRIQADYGIDRAVYLALLALQGGVCYVCGQTPRSKRLAVDHDHKTGEVRGLLCADAERGCNHAVLGSLEARTVDTVIAAAYRLIDYMTKTPYQRLKEAADGPAQTVQGEEDDHGDHDRDRDRSRGDGGPPNGAGADPVRDSGLAGDFDAQWAQLARFSQGA